MTAPSNDNDDNALLMTCPEVATALRVHRQTVWRWARERDGFPKPFRIAHGQPRWNRAEVLDWIRTMAGGRTTGGAPR